jgi:streptomycin 6-kinase
LVKKIPIGRDVLDLAQIMLVSARLEQNCARSAETRAWLSGLPRRVRQLERRWSLRLLEAFDGEEVSCAWVARVLRADGAPAVLKLAMPHLEGKHEIDGLLFWNGDAAVRVLEADRALDALLLEPCVPGTSLRTLPEPEQDVVVASLLKRLWRRPPEPHPFRPLTEMLEQWGSSARRRSGTHGSSPLVDAGLSLFSSLPETATQSVLLATDLHAGNVLRASREPWLAIDPKPYVGDPAYDVTQHLLNCRERLLRHPTGTIARVSELSGLSAERVQSWTVARVAAELATAQPGDSELGLARALARSLL